MTNTTVFITGASSGIGMACATAFARAGARLLLWARRQERLDDLANALRRDHGTDVFTQQVDVRDRPAVEAAIADLDAPWNTIDVLVNNAGLSRGLEPLHEGRYDNWDEMLDTNVKGLLNVTRTIIPGMVERRAGTIINIASIAGLQPYRGGNVYSASKAAVRMLSQSMQIDLNGLGIRVCNVDPGLVETEFSEVRFRGDTERAATVYKGYTPLHANDIADAVLWVATRPSHVSIQDMLITPTDQATTSLVHKV